MSLLSLTQHVTDPTHYSHSGIPAILDLVLTPPTFVTSISVSCPIGASDHNSIFTTITLSSSTKESSSSSKITWQYQKADFESINDHLSSLNWYSILPSDPDHAWSIFISHFFSIVHRFTPSKSVPTIAPPPWLPRPLLHKIQRRRRLFNQVSLSNSPHDWQCYRSVRNSIVNDIRNAKKSYYTSISTSPRSFWSHIRSLRKNKGAIPVLSTPSSSANSDFEKAQFLNSAFSSFFLLSTHLLLPHIQIREQNALTISSVLH